MPGLVSGCSRQRTAAGFLMRCSASLSPARRGAASAHRSEWRAVRGAKRACCSIRRVVNAFCPWRVRPSVSRRVLVPKRPGRSARVAGVRRIRALGFSPRPRDPCLGATQDDCASSVLVLRVARGRADRRNRSPLAILARSSRSRRASASRGPEAMSSMWARFSASPSCAEWLPPHRAHTICQ